MRVSPVDVAIVGHELVQVDVIEMQGVQKFVVAGSDRGEFAFSRHAIDLILIDDMKLSRQRGGEFQLV